MRVQKKIPLKKHKLMEAYTVNANSTSELLLVQKRSAVMLHNLCLSSGDKLSIYCDCNI